MLGDLHDRMGGYPPGNAKHKCVKALLSESLKRLSDLLLLRVVGNRIDLYELNSLALKRCRCRGALSYHNIDRSIYFSESHKSDPAHFHTFPLLFVDNTVKLAKTAISCRIIGARRSVFSFYLNCGARSLRSAAVKPYADRGKQCRAEARRL